MQYSSLRETPSQTGGPYVHIGLLPQQANIEVFEKNFDNNLVQANTQGERIKIEGQVFDGLGIPIRDVLLEIWQADTHGIYPSEADVRRKVSNENFLGWGRAGADFKTGFWSFNTIKPGAVPGKKGTVQAPHISIILFARGINIGLNTRIYFDDELEANLKDPILMSIEWEKRRQTLIAKREESKEGITYKFNIYIQGDNETVFFDI